MKGNSKIHSVFAFSLIKIFVLKMKILFLITFCVISTFSSPLTELVESVDECVDCKEEQEISPNFDAARDVRFLVFTRLNPTAGQEVRMNDIASVQSSNFSPNRPTRVLVHGWFG